MAESLEAQLRAALNVIPVYAQVRGSVWWLIVPPALTARACALQASRTRRSQRVKSETRLPRLIASDALRTRRHPVGVAHRRS